jgi:hypothetical protein
LLINFFFFFFFFGYSRCPVGKWVGRTSAGVVGFLVCNEVEMDPSSLKTLMALIKAPTKVKKFKKMRSISLFLRNKQFYLAVDDDP